MSPGMPGTEPGSPTDMTAATVLLPADKAEYLSETLAPVSNAITLLTETNNGTMPIELRDQALNYLSNMSAESDGHFDGTYIWIGGTEYPVTIDSQDAIDTLVAEGHDRADAQAAFDSMVNAGFQFDQPDDGYVLTPVEFDVLREQLKQA